MQITPGRSFTLPFVALGLTPRIRGVFELRRPAGIAEMQAVMLTRRELVRPVLDDEDADVLACGHVARAIGGADDDRRFDLDSGTAFPPGPRARLRLPLAIGPAAFGMRLTVPDTARRGSSGVVDLVQHDARGRVIGGVAVEVHVV